MGKLTNIKQGTGCLTIFGGVFAIVGLGVGYFALDSLWNWWDARDWESVPATVLSASLRVSQGDDGSTYSAEGQYRYQWSSDIYQNDRISFSSGSDNVGSFHHDAYDELKQHMDSGEPIRVWVNPDDPSDSVVFRDMRWGMFGFLMLFPIIFGGVGIGIITAGWWGGRKVKHEDSMRAQHPGQPWMWREEWSQGVLQSNNKATMWFAIIFAAIWSAMSSPLIFILPDEIFNKGNYLALIGYLFPGVGIGLIIWAISAYRRWKRFGDSELDLDRVPVALGGILNATLTCPTKIPRGNEVYLTLTCISKRRTGSGKNRRRTEKILWQDEQRIPVTINESMNGLSLPVKFHIPKDKPQCDWSDSNNSIVWRLDANADISGADFTASFDLPVFNRGEKYHVDKPETLDNSSTRSDVGDWQRTGVVYKLTGKGERFYFPPARNKSVSAMITLIGLVFTGAGIGIWFAAHPIFGSVFGLIGVLVLWGAVHMWLHRTEVVLRGDALEFRKGLFGLRQPERLLSHKLKNLGIESTMSAGNKRYYDVTATLVDDRKIKLASHLSGKRDVHALTDRFKKTLGLTEDDK